jgi:hypothetical protein
LAVPAGVLETQASRVVFFEHVERAVDDRTGVGLCTREQVLSLFVESSPRSRPSGLHGLWVEHVGNKEAAQGAYNQLSIPSIGVGISSPRHNIDERPFHVSQDLTPATERPNFEHTDPELFLLTHDLRFIVLLDQRVLFGWRSFSMLLRRNRRKVVPCTHAIGIVNRRRNIRDPRVQDALVSSIIVRWCFVPFVPFVSFVSFVFFVVETGPLVPSWSAV